MYTLIPHEGLYRVSDNQYIVANKVDQVDDKIICRHEFDFRGQHIVRDKEYNIGEVGIFWDEDTKDLCSTPLDCSFSIYNFHQKLYEFGLLVDDPNDF